MGDVKYHIPTGFGFSPKASGFYPFGDATALAGEGGVGAKHWRRQKAVFYVFVSVLQYFSTEPIFGGNEILFIFVGCN